MKEKVQLSNYIRPDKECVFIPYTTAGQLLDTEYVGDVRLAGGRSPTLEPKADDAGARAARQALPLQPGRRARAAQLFGSAKTAGDHRRHRRSA